MKAFISLVVFVALTPNSYGDLIMSFTSDGSAQLLTTVNVGQTATLDVYLRQTAGEFNTVPYNAGLVSGGVRLNFGSEVQVNAFTPDAAWELSSLEPEPPPISGYADLATAIFSNLPVLPISNAIKIGTVTFQGVIPGLANITFEDPAGFGLFVLDDFDSTVIDGDVDFGLNAAEIQVNAEAIPEPSSVGLSLLVFGAAFVVTAYRARRRGKKATDDDVYPVTGSL